VQTSNLLTEASGLSLETDESQYAVTVEDTATDNYSV
jgi:hypothetical protein